MGAGGAVVELTKANKLTKIVNGNPFG